MHFVQPLCPAGGMVGRDGLLERVLEAWQSSRGVLVLRGPAGVGKSAVLAEFIARAHVVRGFAWNFDDDPDADAFMRALLTHYAGRESAVSGVGLMYQLVRAFRGPRGYTHFTLALDGLDRMQDADGRIVHHGLKLLLEWLVDAASPPVFAVCTSRRGLPGATGLDVPLLDAEDAVALLDRCGVMGPGDARRGLAETCAFHPLTLMMGAAAVVRWLEGDAARANAELVGRDDLAPIERGVRAAAEFCRRRLDPLALRVLQGLCLFHVPVSVTAVVSVVRLTLEEAETALADLCELHLVKMVSGPCYLARDEIREDFSCPPEEIAGLHQRFAAFLRTRRGLASAGIPPAEGLAAGSPLDRPLGRGLLDLRLAEQFVHHAAHAGRLDDAWEMYWEICGGAAWIALERGDHARGERMARTLLACLKDDARGARLQHELGLHLDLQGRLSEARRHLLRALRACLRQGDRTSACTLLGDLASNALRQGRLPLAEKFAARAVALADGAPLTTRLRAAGLLKTIAFQRRGEADPDLEKWRQDADLDTEIHFVSDLLIGRGEFATAREMAVRTYQRTVDYSARLSRQAALQATTAAFWEMVEARPAAPSPLDEVALVRLRPGRTTLRRNIRDFALEASVCAPLHSVLDWATERGDVAMMCRVLTFHATVCRFAGLIEAADESGREAEYHARHHGLDLALVDALVERADLALDRFDRRASMAPRSLKRALRDPDLKDARQLLDAARALAVRADVDYGAARQRIGQRLAPFPGPRARRRLEQAPARLGPLVASVLVAGNGLDAFLPVAKTFVEAFQESPARAWETCFAAHQRRPDDVVPFYHLAVLLALQQRWEHVTLAATDLLVRHQLALGACLWTAARAASHPQDAARRLEAALRGAPQGRVAAATAFNLGTLARAMHEEARAAGAFARSRQLDWTFVPARIATSIDTSRERCVQRIEQIDRALQVWRRMAGVFPPELTPLVPRWLALVPTCPDGTRYRYRVARGAARCLVDCPHHRVRLDSTLGRLDTAPNADVASFSPLPPLPARALPIVHVCVVTHRILKIVDVPWP